MEKTKDNSAKGYKNLKSLLTFIKPFKWMIVYIVFMSLLAAGLGMLAPLFSAKIVSSITIFEENTLFYSALFLMIASILQEIVYFLSYGCAFRKITQGIVFSLVHKLVEKTTSLKTKNFDKTNSGIFIHTINDDVGNFAQNLIYLTDNLTLVFARLGFLAYVFSLNIWLALFILGETIVIYIIRHFKIRYNFKYNKERKEKNDKKIALIGEIVRGVRDVKSLNLDEGLMKKSDEVHEDYRQFLLKKFPRTYLFRSVERWMSAILYFLFIVLAIYLIKIGNIDPVNAITMIMFRGNILTLVNYLMNMKETLKDMELSAQRINKILGEVEFDSEVFGTETLDTTSAKEIEFKDVEFSYNEGKEVLKKANFKIKPNTTVGIVGESGEGKSTIIKLISKLYDINGGKILINGKDINSLDKDSIRNNISIVPQEPYIFNFTFKENLKLVRPDATDEEIVDACKKAQLHDFIMEQKDEYDTILGENGIVLSGGQKQRLAIARALLRNTPILLFDEATSSLDNENQEKIKKVIASLGGAKTVVIVAHRLSTIRDADNILFIKEGKLFIEGKHKKLMQSCEEYKNLYKSES